MPARRQVVWITRAQPGADATAERVRALRHEPRVIPLLEVRPLPGPDLDLAGVCALAFTSANGVRAFAARSKDRSLKVFAVGSATANAARVAGFRGVLSADGDVAALAEGMATRWRDLTGVVLHPGATELAGDLVGDLMKRGITARAVALYETAPIDLSDEDRAQALAADFVLAHSPRGARALAALLADHPAPGLVALGLSRAVIAPLEGVVAAACPAMPLEAAMLNLIDRR